MITVLSPGRINLIGEHTDYNLGYVLPTAIDKKITFQLRKNNTDSSCNVYSLDYDKGFSFDLNKISRSETEWENYILGVVNEILKRADKLRGFDCTLQSDLPPGSGLSSSAALECGLAFGLNELFDLGLTKKEIVQLSQTAEHTYVGTQCGIMDQFASVMSKEGHVILLDCRSLEHSYIPIDIAPYKILLLNTNVSHNLASSEYNTRRKECAEGVATIQKKYPEVSSLSDADMTILEDCKSEIRDTVYKRCKFIIQENDRVLKTTEALKKNDMQVFGSLLYEGHTGLSQEYEISCPESDFLVDYTKNIPEILGARQMGGGFGGCTINIVHKDAVDSIVKDISAAYKERFNLQLTPIEVILSGGTSKI